MTNPLRAHWTLDPDVCFLNHGSFGATPRVVLDAQSRLRARMERQPVQFFVRESEVMFEEARGVLGAFLGAHADDLAVVPNATAGVNAVLRWLKLSAGDELLTTDHEYNACVNALRAVADPAGARVVVAKVPFPLSDPGEVLEAVMSKVTSRTRLALIDHVTSPTGLVFPIERIVAALRERGVETLVDGAHAPGMLPLSLDALGAGYYTGNLHKWVCAPKGAAFLHVRRELQADTRPLAISHGANIPLGGRSRFRLESDWTGTTDPTAFLVVPDALRFLSTLLPGGWDELRARNRTLALFGRDTLCAALGVAAPAPDSMIGSLASVPLPDALVSRDAVPSSLYADALQTTLWERHRVEVPIVPWPDVEHRLVRVSAQAYNLASEYELLADALRDAMNERAH